jgi:hypothetical protein
MLLSVASTALQGKTMPAHISSLNAAEDAYVKQQLGEATAFVRRFSPGDGGRTVTLDIMDRAFAAWLSSDPQSAAEINQTINVVGAVLGDALCREAGFAWVIASDEYGPISPSSRSQARATYWSTPQISSPSAGSGARPGSSRPRAKPSRRIRRRSPRSTVGNGGLLRP